VSSSRRSVEFRREGFSDYDRCEGHFLIGGEEREINRSNRLVIFLGDLEKCGATDLQAALRRARRICEEVYHPLSVVVAEDDFYHEDILLPEPIRFEMLDDALTFFLSFAFEATDKRDLHQVVEDLVEPLLRRHRMTIVKSESVDPLPWPPELIWVSIWIGFNTRGRTLRELYDVGQDAYALFEAMRNGQLSRQTAGDLIRGGHANVLIGQPEGHWLDVKRQHYDLHTKGGKPKLSYLGQIELAQAVSRFCNSEDGGLVLVGMSTKPVPGGEEIRALHPVPRDGSMVDVYKKALEDTCIHLRTM
jgi:hypothetical protein